MSIADHPAQTQWLAEATIRPLAEADLPALEWDGEFTHFRRVYARAYERSRRGHALLWVAARPPVRRTTGTAP